MVGKQPVVLLITLANQIVFNPVGANSASQFAAEGFRVASASRSKTTRLIDEQHLDVKVDLSDPSTIPGVFRKVEAEFGAPPEVVITIGIRRGTDISFLKPITDNDVQPLPEKSSPSMTRFQLCRLKRSKRI